LNAFVEKIAVFGQNADAMRVASTHMCAKFAKWPASAPLCYTCAGQKEFKVQGSKTKVSGPATFKVE
jgi:hypothetical protein